MKANRFTYAAMAVLGSAAITVSAGTQAAAQPTTTPPDTTSAAADSSTAPCALLHVVVFQGTTESTEGSIPKQDSGTLSAAILPVLAEFGGTTSDKFDRTYVPYPADYGFTGTPYKDSAARGVQNGSKIIADEAARCPNTKFGLLGYSQGAGAASEVLRLIGAGQGPIPPARVAMGMLYSDPTRKQGDGIFPGAPSQEHPAPAPGTRGAEVIKLETLPTPPSDGGGIAPLAAQTPASFGSLTGRVASACASGDIACDTPADAPLARLVTNVSGQMNLNTQDPIG
ncbi:MAG: cutinase family protein, partial [Rhodococcus sp. (in: high G+C Gram-positive bacteria)]